jgi:molybdopterin-containing oxidoreductase family iron-sulfur binding subunit
LKSGWEKHLRGAPVADAPGSPDGGYELVLQQDPAIYDGRFANNGWLQELPRPITTLTWDSAALMSPATARELGVGIGSYAHGGEHGGYHVDVVELRLGDTTVRAPVWIVPGQADGSITVSLGYGREAAGKIGGTSEQKVGFNAYPFRTSERPWFAPGLQVRKTRGKGLLACTQEHHRMERRKTVRSGTLDDYHEKPAFATAKDREEEEAQLQSAGRKPLTMYEPRPFTYDKGHKWGMVIDLTACVGCKACVVACQAESNIPMVGKDQVAAGREMHWLRIDRYLEGPADSPREFLFQPVPCMHCENAPCEYVCPTEATVHSADGLGVMEKCSYCVQRIRRAEIDAQVEDRPIADGEVLTACQAACQAQAIVFGDLNDRASTVSRRKQSPLHYALLAELNTNPRTTYLAALRNPNPELEAK